MALRSAVEAELDRPGVTLPRNAIVGFYSLARDAEEAGNFEACEYWAGRALAIWEKYEKRRQQMTEPGSHALIREMEKQWISIWIAFGRARFGRGDISGAREAFAHARQTSKWIRDEDSLSLLMMNEAQLLDAEGGSVENRLELIRRAWSLAARNGFAQVMTDAANAEANSLAKIGEYDSALEAVERAERAVQWSGRLILRLAPQMCRANLTARRGRPDVAAEVFSQAIGQAASDPVVEAHMRLLASVELAGHAAVHAQALDHVDRVLAAMAEGLIPHDGTRLRLPSHAKIKELRTWVTDTAPSHRPACLVLQDGVSPNEHDLRTELLRAEFARDAATVPDILLRLASGRYSVAIAKPRRMVDLAEAALQAAKRADHRLARLRALHLVTIARDLSGDFQGALEAGRELLEADPPADEKLRIAVSLSLGFVLTKVGRAEEGARLLRKVVDYHRDAGNIDEHARALITLANTLVVAGDRAGAQEILDQGAKVVEATGDPLAIAKHNEMLASLRINRSDPRPAPPPLFVDGEANLTLEQVRQLRCRCESALQKCDIAALALGSGHTRAAVELILEAQAVFFRDCDAHGGARCFHLLADAAQLDGRWDSACDFTRHALTLEDDVQDVPGQIGSYAALALQFLELEQLDDAESAAKECLARAGPRDISRFTVIARYVLAEAHRRAGRSRDARREAQLTHNELQGTRDVPSGSSLRLWLEHRLSAWS